VGFAFCLLSADLYRITWKSTNSKSLRSLSMDTIKAVPSTISLSTASGAASNYEDLYINEYLMMLIPQPGLYSYFQIHNMSSRTRVWLIATRRCSFCRAGALWDWFIHLLRSNFGLTLEATSVSISRGSCQSQVRKMMTRSSHHFSVTIQKGVLRVPQLTTL